MASPVMWGSPSVRKRTSTPSKRARFRALFEEDNETSGDDLTMKLDSVKSHYLEGTQSNNKNDLICALVCTYGLKLVLSFLGALCHIPTSFMNRKEYIHNILYVTNAKFPRKETDHLTDILQEYATETKLSVSSDILWTCTKQFGEGYLIFLAPPVNNCFECGETLYAFTKSKITYFTLQGPLPGLKTTTRCKKGCGAIYNIDRYSVPGKGTHFYTQTVPVISASNCVYLSRDVHELMCESGNHAFVSHHAFSEIYNSLFGTSMNTVNFKNWKTTQNEETIDQTEESEEDITTVNTDDISEYQIEEPMPCYQLTRKKAISAYFNGELLNEINEREKKLIVKLGETREHLMRQIDSLRRQELYEHKTCSQLCKTQGCETLRVIDSCWKVCMPHCMYAVEMEVQGMPLLNFPNVCIAEPKPNSVFCERHHSLLEENGIPTKKGEFLQHIGCSETPSRSEDIIKVDKKTLELSRRLRTVEEDSNAAVYQGTATLIAQIDPKQWKDEVTCNKDTGQKSRLRQRSRGHFISVTGGGHIQYFEPIFKSESPSQVFMIVLRVMMLELSNIPDEKLDVALEKFVLSYDNMCQLDSLKAARDPLPFPAPYDMMWKRITKIIDRLHLQNHKNPKCKELYNPNKIPKEHNTMIAEQTFAWFSRFKKVVNSMNQSHHLFYIHRNIKRRNRYTEQCKKVGRSPLLPGINLNIRLNNK